MAAQKPVAAEYGSNGHCYDVQILNWLTRDNPNRDKSQTSGNIDRAILTVTVKAETGRS